MNKKLLISILGIVLIYAFVLISTNVLNLNRKFYTEEGKEVNDVILDKNMAIKMGKIVLEEYFPSVFINKEVQLEAEENNGIWKVYNVIDEDEKDKKGNVGVFVKLRKRTGEIIEIGVND